MSLGGDDRWLMRAHLALAQHLLLAGTWGKLIDETAANLHMGHLLGDEGTAKKVTAITPKVTPAKKSS